MLEVVLLNKNAKLPTVGHPGEDLGFDLYASETTILYPGVKTAVETGISARYHIDASPHRKFGLLFKDRSSMAAKGITVSAGVIDAGYTGQLKVLLTLDSTKVQSVIINAGDKIAQMLPTEVFTGTGVREVESLVETTRGSGGFGSTGT